MSGVGLGRIAVVDTGSGNLRSVEKALAAAGGLPVLTSDPDVVAHAERIVVPGQGAFGGCLGALAAGGGALREAVLEVVRAGRPYLGICLGLQVLFDESDEAPGVPGLGVLRGRVVRLEAPPPLKIPHTGWNELRVVGPEPEPLLAGLDGAHAYFVHSFHAVPDDQRVVAAWSDHGGPVCAAVRHENVFAVQFHPEKSQRVGLALLAAFVRGAGRA